MSSSISSSPDLNFTDFCVVDTILLWLICGIIIVADFMSLLPEFLIGTLLLSNEFGSKVNVLSVFLGKVELDVLKWEGELSALGESIIREFLELARERRFCWILRYKGEGVEGGKFIHLLGSFGLYGFLLLFIICFLAYFTSFEFCPKKIRYFFYNFCLKERLFYGRFAKKMLILRKKELLIHFYYFLNRNLIQF